MISNVKQVVYLRNIVKPTSICVSRRCSPRLLKNHNPMGYRLCRSMSSQDGDKTSADDSGGKPKKAKEEKVDAKKTDQKLADLLQSIVKDAGVRKKGEMSAESSVKLSVPTKEKTEGQKKKRKSKKEADDSGEVKLGKRVLQAVKEVASSIGGDPVQVESELVNKLRSQNTPRAKLSDLFDGMKIEQRQDPTSEGSASDAMMNELSTSRAARVNQLLRGGQRSQQLQQQNVSDGESSNFQRPRRKMTEYDETGFMRVNLFGARPLGIFPPPEETKNEPDQGSALKTWDSLYQKHLKMLVTHPPANGFEEMILWTEQQKMWKYPIDNEQGMYEEAQCSFEDHVFLETQIEPWCPAKGPVRNFMELVCVGLSKNSYLTVPEKKEYLDWYHEYFRNKASLIKELGAGEVK